MLVIVVTVVVIVSNMIRLVRLENLEFQEVREFQGQFLLLEVLLGFFLVRVDIMKNLYINKNNEIIIIKI